jgi:hypothetical protein
VRRRDGDLPAVRQPLGAGRTRAAEDRGAAMNLATVAEYALMLTAADSPHVPPQGWRTSAPGNASWSPWSPAVASTRRSPPSCSSACARSARSQPEPRLSGHRQRLPASHQDPQIIAGRQQPCAQPGNSLDDMLTVIQHRQQLLPAQHLSRRHSELLAHFQCRGHQSRDEVPGPEQVPARPATPRQRTGPPQPGPPRPTSRVLPGPPCPVTVTSRYRPSSPATSRTCSSRPTRLVSSAGKPCTPRDTAATADTPTHVP